MAGAEKMKYCVIIAFLVIAGLAGVVVMDKEVPVSITKDGDSITISKGKNIVVYGDAGKLDEKFRVFSFQKSEQDDSPYCHIDAFFALLHVNRAKSYWEQDKSEARACKESIVTPIIAANDTVRRKIEVLEELYRQYLNDDDDSNDHFCVHLQGTTLEKREHTFKGTKLGMGRNSLSSSESALVTDIKWVKW